jgi:hypothetical protein
MRERKPNTLIGDSLISKNGLQRKFGKCRRKDVDERQRTSTAKSVGGGKATSLILRQNGPGKTLALVICMRVTNALEVSSKKGEFEKEGEFGKICLKRGTSGFGCR